VNNLDIIVFDFETGGLNANYHEAIQVAGKAYNARTLEPYSIEEGGEFASLMKPLYPDRLDDRALAVNHLTRDELSKAPDQKAVWTQFVSWVMRYNPKKQVKKAPIAAGKNIRNFDLKFVEALNKKHMPKKEKTLLFSKRRELELEDYIFAWFENSSELENEKMDTLRVFFGMSTEGAHDAIVDVRQTGELLMKFLKLHRQLKKRVRFAGFGAGVVAPGGDATCVAG
jgi:DNA polymerase III alpha subunit (gram-positive type)